MSAGLWVFVCGASGAGKDSVIGWAQRQLAGDARIVFTRRMVTRAAGPALEHDEVSLEALHRMHEAGKLAWQWEANGHRYAVAAHYRLDVAAGRVVVVNGSREHVAALPPAAGRSSVLVTVPQQLLKQRLDGRAREDAAAVAQRLARNTQLPPLVADLVLANDGALDQAGARLAQYLQSLATP
ncbi:MAG TPA: phosphonate metabolism protein/1,5-bisphosphokinase (PRPP-forming) PhnN [Ramlibacter sp.]|nr:phosphonate metabolism protein/1,5-bisphosphokinase (PRPP-forming) PhnN [Ramlibacter sp.]